jgi:hypothetical protein
MLESATLRRSAIESARFGLEVWRASAIGDTASVLPELVASGADVAIYRLPAAGSAPVKALAARGIEVIKAGTLVYYTLDLASYLPRPLHNGDIRIAEATADDDAGLDRLVEASFQDYPSHYLANPLFRPADVRAGYREWALGHRRDASRTATWVARRQGRMVGFACCEFDSARRICNGGIYGVLPDESGGGLFGDLIRHTQASFKARGFVEMRMSGNVDNFAVQKVWVREGFHMYAAYDTLHVNALLSAGTTVRRALPWPPAAGRDGAAAVRVVGDAAGALLAELHPAEHIELTEVSLVQPAPPATAAPHVLSLSAVGTARAGGLRRATLRVHDAARVPCLLGYASYRVTPAPEGS